MKRLVATLFFLSLCLLAVALIAPGFIDWSRHKDAILAQIQPYVQRRIEVAGEVQFRLIPNPQILLRNVTIANASGARFPYLLKLRTLEAKIGLKPLLQGRIEVESVNLDEPDLHLEILPDGSVNWSGILRESEKPEAIGGAAGAIRLNRVTLTRGTLSYLNQANGVSWQVDQFNLAIAAETLLGPYRVTGDMLYRDYPVNIEMSTGQYQAGRPVPVRIAFLPIEVLPQIRLEGTADVRSGFDLQAGLDIEQGRIASLFDSSFLGGISFLKEEAALRGTVSLKPGELKISDIKGKFGARGTLTGAVAAQFTREGKPDLTAELEGANLDIMDKAGWLFTPEGFDGHFDLKGKNIVFQGTVLPSVRFSAEARGAEWMVKEARVDFPGNSQVRLAGVATPEKQYAAYTVQVSTEDLPQLLQSLPLDDNNILKHLTPVKKLTLSSSLDLRSDKISLFSMDALLDGKTKVSGVLNVDRAAQRPGFQARLNVAGADLSGEGWKKLAQRILRSDADIDVTGKNISRDWLNMASLAFRARANGQELEIKQMEGSLSESESFSLSGRFGGETSFDLSYALKTGHPGALGIPLPPPLQDDAPVDIKGRWSFEAGQYALTAEGALRDAALSFKGATRNAAEGGDTVWQATLDLKRPTGAGAFALLGLPLDGLLGGEGAFDFSGTVSGLRDDYKIDQLAAHIGDSAVSGAISRKDGKYDADLAADRVDFDSGLWTAGEDMVLRLKGKKLIWHGQEMTDAALTLEAGPAHVGAHDLTARLWDGNLEAALDATKNPEGLWEGTLKGGITGADLDHLRGNMGLTGFSVGRGDISFELASSGKVPFLSPAGSIGLKASSLTVERFNTSELSSLLSVFRQAPSTLPETVSKALKSHGATVYAGIAGDFGIDQGKISIRSLDMSCAAHALSVTGSLDPATGKYNLSAEVQLKVPADAPVFTVTRTGSTVDYTVSVKPLSDYIARHALPETQSLPEKPEKKEEAGVEAVPLAAPPAPAALPPAPPPPSHDQAIRGILDRLQDVEKQELLEGTGAGPEIFPMEEGQ